MIYRLGLTYSGSLCKILREFFIVSMMPWRVWRLSWIYLGSPRASRIESFSLTLMWSSELSFSCDILTRKYPTIFGMDSLTVRTEMLKTASILARISRTNRFTPVGFGWFYGCGCWPEPSLIGIPFLSYWTCGVFSASGTIEVLFSL